jgi:hypothetical protein
MVSEYLFKQCSRLINNQFDEEEDRADFRSSFDESTRTRNELLCYVRLKCKGHFSVAEDYNTKPKEVLFEFKGHAHFVEEENACKCFFAVAKPYPTRNTAMYV